MFFSYYIFLFFSYYYLFPYSFFFFNDTATTEIYTLSLHDALPTCSSRLCSSPGARCFNRKVSGRSDRKSTRLNSSHLVISYAVFCLKKKNKLQFINRDVERSRHDTLPKNCKY